MISALILAALLYTTTVDAGVYTRWGRKACEGDASVILNGYMATSHYNDAGNGKNYVCLAAQPEWGNINAANQGGIGALYGVHYAIGTVGGFVDNKPFSWANFNGQNPDYYPVPCAVCKTPNIDVVMLTGKLHCPADWYGEYSGYIVSAHYGNYGTEYVCLDSSPEPFGAQYTTWQASLLTVDLRCGVLPCSTFPNVNEVSCVVCSQ